MNCQVIELFGAAVWLKKVIVARLHFLRFAMARRRVLPLVGKGGSMCSSDY